MIAEVITANEIVALSGVLVLLTLPVLTGWLVRDRKK